MVEEENSLVFVLIGEYFVIRSAQTQIFCSSPCIIVSNNLFVVTLQMKLKALLLLERLLCLVLNLQILYGYSSIMPVPFQAIFKNLFRAYNVH